MAALQVLAYLHPTSKRRAPANWWTKPPAVPGAASPVKQPPPAAQHNGWAAGPSSAAAHHAQVSRTAALLLLMHIAILTGRTLTTLGRMLTPPTLLKEAVCEPATWTSTCDCPAATEAVGGSRSRQRQWAFGGRRRRPAGEAAQVGARCRRYRAGSRRRGAAGLGAAGCAVGGAAAAVRSIYSLCLSRALTVNMPHCIGGTGLPRAASQLRHCPFCLRCQ